MSWRGLGFLGVAIACMALPSFGALTAIALLLTGAAIAPALADPTALRLLHAARGGLAGMLGLWAAHMPLAWAAAWPFERAHPEPADLMGGAIALLVVVAAMVWGWTRRDARARAEASYAAVVSLALALPGGGPVLLLAAARDLYRAARPKQKGAAEAVPL